MILWGIVGRKDMGKTTLVARLVSTLSARGLTVSTLKRTHHAVDLDTPGSDSHRHREAGARQVLLASDARVAVMEETAAPLSLATLLTRLEPCDVVLAEGWKAGDHPRIEAWRPGAAVPLAAEDATIRAVACPAGVAPLVGCPLLDLDDADAVADFLLR